MLTVIFTGQFKRDVKRIEKRKKDLEKLKDVMAVLASGESLDKKYHDHNLSGDYAHRRECHIEPDWLLIYKQEQDSLIFERTGTHADLF